MAAAKPMKSGINVRVEGLAQLDRTDSRMEGAQREYLQAAGERLRTQLVSATPRKSGAMAGAWTLTVDAPLSFVLVNAHPGAKARDRGAYIRPKRRSTLRFVGADGMFYTRKGIKQKPMNFTKKGLRGRGRIVSEEFAKAMDKLTAGGV